MEFMYNYFRVYLLNTLLVLALDDFSSFPSEEEAICRGNELLLDLTDCLDADL